MSISSKIAQLTAQFDHITYGMGHKIGSGKVDCSNWTEEVLTRIFREANQAAKAAGKADVFSASDFANVADYSDLMFRRVRDNGGGNAMSDKEQVRRFFTTQTSGRDGYLVFVDTGDKNWENNAPRPNDIDHVVLTYIDPTTGTLMISQSSGSNGVNSKTFDEWWRTVGDKARSAFAVDPFAMAENGTSRSEINALLGGTFKKGWGIDLPDIDMGTVMATAGTVAAGSLAWNNRDKIGSLFSGGNDKGKEKDKKGKDKGGSKMGGMFGLVAAGLVLMALNDDGDEAQEPGRNNAPGDNFNTLASDMVVASNDLPSLDGVSRGSDATRNSPARPSGGSPQVG